MTRQELLAISKPILFNTEMVIAILDNRKKATRRLIKPPYFVDGDEKNPRSLQVFRTAYKTGDYLYVRETWQEAGLVDDFDQVIESTMKYYYAAGPEIPSFTFWLDPYTGDHKDHMPWRPSIHMPKEAARIFLRVTDVRVERLQNMTLDDFLVEGVVIRPEAFNDPDNAFLQAREQFIKIWNSTLKKDELNIYGWNANPWIWKIEFEKVEV